MTDHDALTDATDATDAPDAPCAICGRELWSDGLAPALDADEWICGDCDQARTFQSLDL